MSRIASVYDFAALSIRTGERVPFSRYRGKVALVVNVSSGATKRDYKALQTLHTNYHEKGLEILAFPCNQFGKQEPGTHEEIMNFVTSKFGVEFEIFEKTDVNGNDGSPLFALLKEETGCGDVSWNFEKFLVNREGRPVSHHSTRVSAADLEEEIRSLLHE